MHLTVLLPCHSLEDLTPDRSADEAEQILSAWSALWHPALVAQARAMPHWSPSADPPQEPGEHLIAIPPCCEALLPGDWLGRAEEAGAILVRHLHHRREMVAAALERMPPAPSAVDAELAADFLALGFCHFSIEVLTRHLRYMSNLDEPSFEIELLAAAEEAVKGNTDAARGRLQAAFDLLHTAREYFYPVEAHLLDLTLVAATTIGPSLRAELAAAPVNVMVTGAVIEEMARREPQSLAALRAALENNTAALVGGEYGERELPLLPLEAVREEFRRGITACEHHLGTRPTVFGRRRYGLTPALPQVLKQLGFVGAMHVTLDDGRFPTGNQSRVRWAGVDGTALEALARIPADITRADAFLRLPRQLGGSMDLDHVATAVLAHWPGQSSPWYRDLRRIAAYTSVVGKFTSITDYFDRTGMAAQETQHKADEYRSPYLRQAVDAGQADPISRWARYYSRRAAAEAIESLDALSTLVRGTAAVSSQAAEGVPLMREVEESLDNTAEESLDRRLAAALDEAVVTFSRAVAGPGRAAKAGVFVANPCSFPRRMCFEVPQLRTLPDVVEPVQAAAESAGRNTIVVDVPPLGFAWLVPGSGAPAPVQPAARKWGIFAAKAPAQPPLAEQRVRETSGRAKSPEPPVDSILRNEFFEIAIDSQTGAIRAISDYRSRGPRLAQQIAMRLPHAGRGDEAGDGDYSIMAADEVTITSPGPVLGEVVARGRLVDRSARRLAGFCQTTRVWRGSRVIELLVDLDISEPPGADPWNSYYAARFAWSDESASLYRSVNQANVPTDAQQLEAPHFIDVRSGKLRTTLLTAGLPYHRRIGLRKLDTLLVVQGETAGRFRLGIGMDVPNPLAAALDFLAPPALLPGATPPQSASGWLFHLDARNVVATHWEPLLEGDAGQVAGFRVRLLETDGRSVSAGLRAFRAPQSARKLGAGDDPPTELAVAGDQITVDLGAYEWAEVEARF